MSRPLAYDLTHVALRLHIASPSGIDKVDLAYARHFAQAGCELAVHYGLRRPRIHPGESLAELVEVASRSRWIGVEDGHDPASDRVAAILGGRPAETPAKRPTMAAPASERYGRRLTQLSWLLSPGRRSMPPGTLYLNVAQYAFEHPRYFNWLEARRDVRPVFLVHDLLPMDYPEYFRPGYRERFRRRLDTIVGHGAALITTSTAVKERLAQELAARQRPAVPILVEPLPSTMPAVEAGVLADPELARQPYFVVLGTIEPRKNHLLLLNIWRRLAEEERAPPRLVIIGVRGWENEQALDVLDRSTLVKPHIVEASGIGDKGLMRLLANARGLLMPSFAEGYGLPVVEALSLGTPVIASDIPVFEEISQGRALLRHPLDGVGWREAILALSDLDNPLAIEARRKAEAFRPPTWPAYFQSVETFLAKL